MSALAFTDQRLRLRRILANALEGAAYDSSRTEDGGRTLVIHGRRRDGRPVTVRFRGVRQSQADSEPTAGSSLRVRSVASAGRFSWLALFFPFARRDAGASRVRIEAGASKLEIVCEDAEWWEEEATGGP